MKKYLLLFFVISLIILPVTINAQLKIMAGPRMGYGYLQRRYSNNRNRQDKELPPFKPFVSISWGYGFS